MGKTASNWSAIEKIIKAKDDAIDQLTQQLNAAQQNAVIAQKGLDAANAELTTLRSQFDEADLAALAEMDKVVAANPVDPAAQAAPKADPAPAADAAPAAKPAADAPAMTTFTK